jgi:hypothetical protein
MIEEYKQAINRFIVWPAFTSTSKDRGVAENFGNTLFIIRLLERQPQSVSDISSLSIYPNEQEVLLVDGYLFHVEWIEFNSKSGKYQIDLAGVSSEHAK